MATPKRYSPSLNETVVTLRERLKHGENIVSILENQITAAQKNINFLQGQIHLANETVMNLKKHFHETEEMLSNLVPSERLVSANSRANSNLKLSDISDSMESSPRSPVSSGTSSTISSRLYEERFERKKSPYAQQLRQVLDVLQDEEPQRSCGYYPREVWRKGDYNASSCKKFLNCNLSHDGNNEYYELDHKNKKDDYSVISPSDKSFSNESKGYSRMRISPHRLVCSRSHYNESPCINGNENKIRDQSPNSKRHHLSLHSSSQQLYHDKFFYPPNHSYSVGEIDLQEDCTTLRRKRSHVLGDEPPHLKYTKVKRIDGSKLTAQKTLLDFIKRRFLPYNPRYDLDLLIVSPPIPATELLKSNSTDCKKEIENVHHANSLKTKVYKNINGKNNNNSSENKILCTQFHEYSANSELKGECEEKSKLEEVMFKLRSSHASTASHHILEEQNAPIVVGGSRTA